MGFGDKKKKSVNPVNLLNEHVSAFMYWVRQGKVKFNHKKDISDIFLQMESNAYLFQQATSGTMYDYKKKLDRNVWAAAMHVYGEHLQELKAALLRAVDACETDVEDEEAAAVRLAEEEKKRKEAEEKLSLREQMALAEAREKEESEAKAAAEQQYRAEADREADAEAMTEADCRDLWKIYQSLQGEYKVMDEMAGRWLSENPDKGCFGVALAVLALPIAAAYGLFHLL